ncbi:tetratricopeptide repeat protein [Desulfomonile tiedjei]|uniref:Tfp pilus assembly protein PilF n=1 Tax=Desulfomonile tiedjei (strain ATCC 49306 / DSM 6799 / DCB-1) TaxID=706587 RepID=I4C7C9_DESTA|nr:tetratricopeptide repeat protein [Desulfomonile tiedjei]AFM25470.1 Tfp pilus assembly protein PilF [Desulfomonile tiedjei DSM 6799]
MKRTLVLPLSLLTSVVFLLSGGAALGDPNSYQKGLQALKAGDNHAAIRNITKALEFDPGNYRYYNDRGVAYKKSGELEKALADYTRALDIRPDYTNALNNRGVVFLQKNDFERAIQDFMEALKYGGLESTVHTNLGLAYAQKADYQHSVKEFEKAIANRPTDPRAFLFMAESLEALGEKAQSLKLYRKARTAASDPSAAAEIERKIALLEKTALPGSGNISFSPTREPRTDSGNTAAEQTKIQPKRGIQLARPLPEALPEPKPVYKEKPPTNTSSASQKTSEPPIESLQELERKSRARALERFSPASREIYLQGVQFVEQSDVQKALIRFEDSSQLEKRSKNSYAVGWNALELGRVHARLNQHARAAAYFEDALRSFLSQKAGDEVILTLVELAASKKTLGQKEKASSFYSRAIDEANSRGYSTLASALEDVAAGKPPKKAPEKTASEKPKHQPEEKTTVAQAKTPPQEPEVKRTTETKPSIVIAKITAPDEKKQIPEVKPPVKPNQPQIPAQKQDFSKIESVGKGPATETGGAPGNDHSGQPKRITLSIKNPLQPKEKLASEDAHRALQPEGRKKLAAKLSESNIAAVPVKPEVRPSHAETKDMAKSIQQDLSELRKLRQKQDESQMIVVLERIAEKFTKNKDYEKALHGLSASLAFREKLGRTKGLDEILYKSGTLKEQMGQLSAALEDLTRASVIDPGSKVADSAARAARSLATKMKLENTLIEALKNLWRSRMANDNQTETQALYAIATGYEKARRLQDALDYYDRSSASVLADKARVYEKSGKSELAEQAYSHAMEAFRKLDYTRYLNMKQNPKKVESLSRQ